MNDEPTEAELNGKRRCVKCNTEYVLRELMKHPFEAGCPKCQSKGIMMIPEMDITIKVNIHELRILGMWAENYAVTQDNLHLDNARHDSLKETVGAIAARIEAQFPKEYKHMPMTLSGEFGQMKKQFGEGKVEFFRDGREEA